MLKILRPIRVRSSVVAGLLIVAALCYYAYRKHASPPSITIGQPQGSRTESALSHTLNLITLGDPTATTTWIYLCGLTPAFDAVHEVNKRRILDEIGKQLKLKFIAIKPPQRCPEFSNRLCWPHATTEEVLATYDYIRQQLKDQPYAGLIGFSNGSYFLTKLVQTVALHKPVVAIAGAVHLSAAQQPNTVYLLVSSADEYNYGAAQKFYGTAQDSALRVTLQTYDGGHELPVQPLADLLVRT